jgi:hypothetical protein
MSYTNKTALFLQEKFEVIKKAIRICKSKKDRQYNGQNKKTKGRNNTLQNAT